MMGIWSASSLTRAYISLLNQPMFEIPHFAQFVTHWHGGRTSKLPSSSQLTTSRFSTVGVVQLTLLSTRRQHVVAPLHDVRCKLQREPEEKAVAVVGDAGGELCGPSPKVLRSWAQMDGSSCFGLDDGRI